MSNLSTAVNQLVANLGVLYVKLHQFHWYVQGPDFFTLHEKFEELYDETTAQFDLFAERLIILGERPYSTLGEFLQHASIEERPYNEEMTATEMILETIDDYETMKKLTKEAANLANDADDLVTEDLLITYLETIELTLWMLKAYNGQSNE